MLTSGCRLILRPARFTNLALLTASVQTSACCKGRGPGRGFSQRISFQQRYEWLLGVKKHKKRALYPFIPREAPTGITVDGVHVEVAEMRPEFVVPKNLDKSEMRPYVDWKAKFIQQSEFTSKDLFDACYGVEIGELHVKGKLKTNEIMAKYSGQTSDANSS